MPFITAGRLFHAAVHEKTRKKILAASKGGKASGRPRADAEKGGTDKEGTGAAGNTKKRSQRKPGGAAVAPSNGADLPGASHFDEVRYLKTFQYSAIRRYNARQQTICKLLNM